MNANCRFPFQANEIFQFEINSFLDKFFEAPSAEEEESSTASTQDKS